MTTTTTSTLPLAPGRWALDPDHSSVGFSIRHLGVSKVRGRFTSFDVDAVVGPTPAGTSIVATVDLASIETGNADRDAHCRQPDMIDVERRPTMVFRSTAISGDGDDWTLAGDLTIGDVTRPLTLAVELGGVEASPMGGPRHAGFEATGEVRRSDFGIAAGVPAAVLGDVIKVQLDVQLLEPGAD